MLLPEAHPLVEREALHATRANIGNFLFEPQSKTILDSLGVMAFHHESRTTMLNEESLEESATEIYNDCESQSFESRAIAHNTSLEEVRRYDMLR